MVRGRSIAVTCGPGVSQCADTQRIARGFGSALAELRPGAAELVVLDGVHRAAVTYEQDGHLFGQIGKVGMGFGHDVSPQK